MVRSLAALLCLAAAAPAIAAPEQPIETPIGEPAETPIAVPSLLAWKPMLLSVRVDTGAGAQFGSNKVLLLRALGRWTTTMFGDKLMARAEIEGGEVPSETPGTAC